MAELVLSKMAQAALDGVRFRLAKGMEPSRVDVEILIKLVEAAYKEVRP